MQARNAGGRIVSSSFTLLTECLYSSPGAVIHLECRFPGGRVFRTILHGRGGLGPDAMIVEKSEREQPGNMQRQKILQLFLTGEANQ